jgi:hypothetical protein
MHVGFTWLVKPSENFEAANIRVIREDEIYWPLYLNKYRKNYIRCDFIGLCEVLFIF